MQNFIKQVQLMPFNENVLEIFIGKQKIGLIGEIDLSVTDKLIKKQAFGFEIYPEKISLFLKKSQKLKRQVSSLYHLETLTLF